MNRLRASVGFWRSYLLGVVSCAALALLWQAASQPPPAYAQIPDSGAQRNRMIQELADVNKKLAQITDVLKEIRDLEKAALRGEQTQGSGPGRP